MSKKLIISLAALVLVFIAGLLLVNNRNSALRGGMTLVDQSNFQSEVLGADRPVIVVVTGSNCADCPAVIEAIKKEIAKYPGVKFVLADGAQLGAPATALPAILSVLPQLGPTAQKLNIKAADVPAYIAKRADIGTKQMAAVTKVAKLEKEIATKSKPFDDEAAAIEKRAAAALQPVKDRATVALKPIQDEATKLNARITTALGTLPQELDKARQAQNRAEFDRIRGEIAKKVEPFQPEIDALKKKMEDATAPFKAEAEAVMKPFQDELAKVDERRTQAVGPLEKEDEAAQSELMQLVMADQVADSDQPAQPAPKK